METALLHLVLYMTTPIGTQVAQHLAEHILQAVVTHLPAELSWRAHRIVSVVGNVEGCAETVTALSTDVGIRPFQAFHICLGTQHAGDDDAVEGHILDIERIHEVTSNAFQQVGSPGPMSMTK